DAVAQLVLGVQVDEYVLPKFDELGAAERRNDEGIVQLASVIANAQRTGEALVRAEDCRVEAADVFGPPDLNGAVLLGVEIAISRIQPDFGNGSKSDESFYALLLGFGGAIERSAR